MKKTDPPVIVEETFDVSPAVLWAAVTEPRQMRLWFFENIESFEPRTEFETRFVVENDGRKFVHLWKITKVEPLKKITYNWKYEGYPGDSFVTFEISEQGQKTRLKLVHTFTEDFPEGIPEFTRESCFGGWRYFINESLRGYLDSEEAD